jgi:hypothetical protein
MPQTANWTNTLVRLRNCMTRSQSVYRCHVASQRDLQSTNTRQRSKCSTVVGGALPTHHQRRRLNRRCCSARPLVDELFAGTVCIGAENNCTIACRASSSVIARKRAIRSRASTSAAIVHASKWRRNFSFSESVLFITRL